MSLLNSIVGFWNLDESTGDAADASGNGYTLTNSNVTYASGAVFDSTSDRLSNTNTVFDFARTQAFSVSTWVTLASLGSNQFFVANQQNGGDFIGWSIYHSTTGRVNFDMVQDLSPLNLLQVRTGDSKISTSLAHIVFTKNTGSTGTDVRIYVNNVNETLTVSSNSLTSALSYASDLNIGNRGTGAVFNANATIRNTGIWTRELTAAEVTTLYNGGTPLSYAQMTQKERGPVLAFF